MMKIEALKNYEELRRFARWVRKRVRNDWDAVLAITGSEGVGKSSLAFWLGLLVDENFDIKKNFVFSPNGNTLIDQVKALPKYGFINLDEGIKVLYKMEWWSKLQRIINKIYTLNRFENKITCICIPNFSDLSPFFRKHRVYFWVHVYSRGKAVLFMKPRSLRSDDPWFSKDWDRKMKKSKADAFMGDDEWEYELEKHRCFSMFLRFPDVPDDVKEFMISQKKSADEDLDYDGKRDICLDQRDRAVYALSNFCNYTQIGAIIGMSRQSASLYAGQVRQSVNAKIIDDILHINHKEKVEKTA